WLCSPGCCHLFAGPDSLVTGRSVSNAERSFSHGRNRRARNAMNVADRSRWLLRAGGLILGAAVVLAARQQDSGAATNPRGEGNRSFEAEIAGHAADLFERGRQTFRFDTFGDEAFWGGTLRIHEAIEGEQFGG